MGLGDLFISGAEISLEAGDARLLVRKMKRDERFFEGMHVARCPPGILVKSCK